MSQVYRAIGLMSGTSLDGLDIAYCTFELTEGDWNSQILHTQCINFPAELEKKLKAAPKLASEELCKLNITFGSWIGNEVKEFIIREQVQPQFIASHGYTVFHQPENNFTLQIGSGEEIHKATGVTVVNNFRQLDVSLGGQGAPLVPIGDKLLYKDHDICINLGGIANISFEDSGKRIAYDICPVNMVLNHLAAKKGSPFDFNGEMARAGSFLPKAYDSLEKIAYYGLPYPKSLGFEWVRDEIFSLPFFSKEAPENLANTFIHHIANRITSAVLECSYLKKNNIRALITGGGAHNIYLMETIQNSLGDHVKLTIPSKEIIDYKESQIFAFLGLLRLKNIQNCLSSVTGASMNNCGGQIIGDATCFSNDLL